MNYFRRIVKKLHTERLYYKLLKPMLRKNANLSDNKTARMLLQEYAPKPSGTSVGCNLVLIPPKYDLMIVIAAYNAEKYLEDCLDSVMNQRTRYSVLTRVVNDGSTDRTAEILEQYQKNNLINIEVITQNNQGLSGARNTAIQSIPSKYIMFLDADDKLEDGALELMLSSALQQQADIVEGNYYLLQSDGNKRYPSGKRHEDTSFSTAYCRIYGFACMKLFRSGLFDSVIFPEGFWFEDTIVSMVLFAKVKKAVTLSSDVYAYRMNSQGITATAVCSPKAVDSYWILEQLLEDLPEHKIQYSREQYHQVLRQLVINQSRATNLPEEVQKALFVCGAELIRRYFPIISGNERFWLREVSDSLLQKDFCRFCLLCDVGVFETP